jgi:hypothetical protein
MPWAQGGPHRYSFRKRKVGGRVVRRSYGRGPEAQLAAALDARRSEERETSWAARHREKCHWQTGAAPVQQLIEVSDLLVRAALLAAGFHQHQFGEWRRKHGHSA